MVNFCYYAPAQYRDDIYQLGLQVRKPTSAVHIQYASMCN